MSRIFITGGTGYIGKRLIKILLERGYSVTALIRKGSEHKLPAGTDKVIADPFDSSSFENEIATGSIFVQLLGVSHPSPVKAGQFRDIDLRSVKASADAAKKAGVQKFVYVSVAMAPSSIMHAYQEARIEGEKYCLNKKLNCVFIRPWYVLGPGHWWPILMLPLYAIAELVPPLRNMARAKGLVTIRQMLRTLILAIESDPVPVLALEINDIRKSGTLQRNVQRSHILQTA